MPENTGTTQPREKIFQEALGEAVLVMDCHVLLAPGAIEKLIAFYDANPDNGDILSGPLVHDDLGGISTHFQDEWGGEMWGRWGTDSRGANPDGEPFEIFAQGLGLFSCRKSKWLGFNPNFLGFGGEEGYIHTKFRQAGRKALCLPFLRWWHRFGRPSGVKYPLTRWNKLRNYVLGFQELGLDLAPVHKEFVASGKMPQSEWDAMLTDPVGSTAPAATCVPCSKQAATMEVGTLADFYTQVQASKRDLDQHLPKLKELAENCAHVTEFTDRRESTVALAAAKPKTLISHTKEPEYLKPLHQMVKAESAIDTFTTHEKSDPADVAEISETDMLFLDSGPHKAERLWSILEKHGHKVKRYIVLHDTALYSEEGEGGGPGYLPAHQAFLNRRDGLGHVDRAGVVTNAWHRSSPGQASRTIHGGCRTWGSQPSRTLRACRRTAAMKSGSRPPATHAGSRRSARQNPSWEVGRSSLHLGPRSITVPPAAAAGQLDRVAQRWFHNGRWPTVGASCLDHDSGC